MQENQIIYGQEQSNYRQNDKQNNLKQDNREKEVMEVSLQAGHLLLENGAEISRVEETIERICRYYGVCSGNAFVLTNGIFITVGSRNEPDFAKVLSRRRPRSLTAVQPWKRIRFCMVKNAPAPL